MTRKLAIRSLRRGVGSINYIQTLLIMEDDLDEEPEPQDVFLLESNVTDTNVTASTSASISPEPGPSGCQPAVDWCVCRNCRPMPPRTKFSPRSRRDLGEILGRILAAEIFGSRRDLAEIPKSRRPKSCRDLAEIQ